MTVLTREQVRAVDRLAIEKYNVPGIVLMENAARGAAEVALEMLGPAEKQKVVILCGGGNNGGDGLAVARHLHNRGHDVHIVLCTDPGKYQGDALANWRIVQAMRISHAVHGHLPPSQLIIDAIFGTGLTEKPRPPFEQIVDQVNKTRSRILAIDIPSGLDCDSGVPLGPCIRATRTVTFVGQKIGFLNPAAREFTGEVSIADIGCPRAAIDDAIKMHPR